MSGAPDVGLKNPTQAAIDAGELAKLAREMQAALRQLHADVRRTLANTAGESVDKFWVRFGHTDAEGNADMDQRAYYPAAAGVANCQEEMAKLAERYVAWAVALDRQTGNAFA